MGTSGRRLSKVARSLAWAAAAAVLWVSAAAAQPAATAGAILDAVVRLEARIPRDAATAAGLGTQRAGHGIVIDDSGLVLTIGYLILEAAEITLETGDGASVGAEFVAYDYDSGLGLVRALAPLDVAPIRLGDSDALRARDRVLVVGSGGPGSAIGAIVVSRRVFTGQWEYMLEDAIFTSPPHTNWGGTALLNSRGELVGVGSLFVRNAHDGDVALPGNMFVPINLLKPALAEMLTEGHGPGRDRPWLGVFSQGMRNVVVITSMWVDGPAARAGLRPGDMIVGVAGARVTTQEDFYRALWSRGTAGVEVPIEVVRDGERLTVTVKSASRYDFLKPGGNGL